MASVTVVIPLFNKAPYIERALKSVFAQTVTPNEVIVVDDGSTDGGGDLVKSFGNPHLRLIRQKNQGGGAARNRGISEARGELIAFLDADDAWKPRFLETVLSLQKKFPEAGAYGTAHEMISPQGEKQFPNSKIFQYVKLGLVDYLKGGFPVLPSASMVPKKVLKEIGGFPVGVYKGDDVDTWVRIALRYPIAWSSEYLAIWYHNAGNRMGNTAWRDEPPVSKTVRQLLHSGLVPAERKQDLRDIAAYFQLAAAMDCLMGGKRRTAAQLLDYARGTERHKWWWWKVRLALAIPGNAGPRMIWRIVQSLRGLAERLTR